LRRGGESGSDEKIGVVGLWINGSEKVSGNRRVDL